MDKIKKEKTEIKKEVQNILDEINKEFKKSNFLFFEGLRYSKGRKPKLDDLFWLQIKINSEILKEEYQDYTHILLTPYIVTKHDINELELCYHNDTTNSKQTEFKEDQNEEDGELTVVVVHNDRWGNKEKECRSHIDGSTGNIHVKFDDNKWLENPCFKQAILVKGKHRGPKLETISLKKLPENKISNAYLFKNKNVAIIIPKCCYYPSIEEAETYNYKDNEVKDLLIQLLNNVLQERMPF